MGELASLIRASSNQWFHVIPVWAYAIIGDVLAFYHDQISAHLLETCTTNPGGSMNEKNSGLISDEALSDFLQSFDELIDTAEVVTQKLAPMLLANLFSSLLFALTFTFRAIEDVRKQEIIASVWDLSDVLDAAIRFWVVAHTADRLRRIVINLKIIRLNHNNLQRVS